MTNLTPELRAAKLLDTFPALVDPHTSKVAVAIAQAIREAVEAETERCAKIADDHPIGDGIAMLIRARSAD